MNMKRKKRNFNRQKEKAIFVSEPQSTVEIYQYLPELDTELFSRILETIVNKEKTNEEIQNAPMQAAIPEEHNVREPVEPLEPSPPQEPVIRFGIKLSDLIDARLQVFTSNGPISGNLVAAKNDYLSLSDATQTPTFIPYKSIEFLIAQ